MHEHAIIKDIIKQIQSIAAVQGALKVVGVSIKLGALCHITPRHFREHFELLSRGTVAERAKLSFEVSKGIDDPHAQNITLESIDVEKE
jgi:hydrogenase nickel incorporation protein HypA/HybF